MIVCVLVCILLNIVLASVMYLHSNMQEESILEHTNAKCHLCTPYQLVDHCIT